MTSCAPAILFEYARTFLLPLFSAGRIIICLIPLNRRRTGTLSFSWLAGFPFPAPRNSPAPSTIILISSSAVTARQPFLSTADTFIDYLNAVRTARAHQLIATTDMKLGEIAQKTGFSSSDYMSRVFKSIHGVAPSQFRRANTQRS